MGRFGPAFLAYDNFKVYTEWNNSLIYSLTAAYYASRLAGAPAYNPGMGDKIPGLNQEDVRELQTVLAKRGFDVGRIDGILGLKSRQAVRSMQIKLKLPADSWPTVELLGRLRGAR
jgi:membrane-bound lytic murein transglycosylase B